MPPGIYKRTEENITRYWLGKKRPHSEETKRKISYSKKGEKNPNWTGDSVSYKGLHLWVNRNKVKPDLCEICKIKKPYDLANISQEYKRDINDFEWLCRKCHMIKDGRWKIMKKGTRKGLKNKSHTKLLRGDI